jgi:two-component system, cell cycle sensor histidine kinase and response regulator CckA
MALQGNGTSLNAYYPGSTFELLPPALAESGQPQTVLVADDEAIVRTVVTSMLRRLGCNVITACDGREALRTYAGSYSSIDLVIFDLMLPDMTGEELYRQLRLVNPRISAMLITGYSESHLLSELMREGVSGVLAKPFDIHELQTELGRVLAA